MQTGSRFLIKQLQALKLKKKSLKKKNNEIMKPLKISNHGTETKTQKQLKNTVI
jgi:hypothetical protein